MTNFQTPQTWLGHNEMRYRDLNALPHALPHTLPYIFCEICLILGYLQRATTRYHHFFKKKNSIYMYIYFFYKFDGNAL